MATPARTLHLPYQPVKRPTIESVALRLHHLHGDSARSWEGRIYGSGSVYRRVAQINTVLRDLGQTEKVCELMAVVDASMASTESLELCEALHRAEIADAAEQMADETFRDRLRQGTATVAEANEYIRKSCLARAAAEKAEAEVRTWIGEQEAK